jgi:hypothetical protein
VNYCPEDMLRLVTRERQEQRVRDAEAARLGREIRGTTPLRRRLTAGHMFGTTRREAQPRLDG